MKHKIGVALLLLVFILCTTPFGIFFSIPIYIIGLILIWLSDRAKRFKWFWTVLPVIVCFPIFYASMSLRPVIGMSLAQKLEFHFPEEFKGRVTIVYPVEWGQEVYEENGREIINVPEDGIVYYQGAIDAGYANWTFKMINEEGKGKDLYEFKEWDMNGFEKNIKEDSLGVFLGGGWNTTSYDPPPSVQYNVRLLWVNEWRKKNISELNEDSLQAIIQNTLKERTKN